MNRLLAVSHTAHADGSIEKYQFGMPTPVLENLLVVGKQAMQETAQKKYLERFTEKFVEIANSI